MTRKRKLRAEEQDLWSRVAATAVPLNPKRVEPTPVTLPEPDRKTDKTPDPKPIEAFTLGERAPAASRIPTPRRAPPLMDAKAYRKLSRGKLKPEARLDLHGMTVDRAHPALTRFILGSHARGLRLVLVITGKGEGAGPGGPLPYQRGILRRQVPHWLAQAPLAPLILETVPAGRRHGGEGALYVYLRRQR
ncbi:MAG: Smr/MutS family protein [Pseudomonadota bacterium]